MSESQVHKITRSEQLEIIRHGEEWIECLKQNLIEEKNLYAKCDDFIDPSSSQVEKSVIIGKLSSIATNRSQYSVADVVNGKRRR